MKARDIALQALLQIETQQTHATEALERALSNRPVEKRERALATELVYGVCRRLNTLDHVLGRFSRNPVSALDPAVRNTLRLALYQVMFTRIPARAAVNEAVEAVKRRNKRASGFVNGVLRALLRSGPLVPVTHEMADRTKALSIEYSHPGWLVERWVGRYGEAAARAIMDYNNRTPALVVRANTLRTTPEALMERLRSEGVDVSPGRYFAEALMIRGVDSLQALASFREGLFTVQDESSMTAAHALNPQPRHLVIDMAAAPGGKTTHIAELMGCQGRVVAIDVSEDRLGLVSENCRRLGLECVETIAGDAVEVVRRFAGQADRVLLDAPCSGLGTLNRRADARWRKSEQGIAEITEVQTRLLDGAVSCLAPGGILVYSTCTTEPEENQDMIASFLKRHPEMEPDDLTPFIPSALAAGGAGSSGHLQFLPHIHGVNGFFVARIKLKRDAFDQG